MMRMLTEDFFAQSPVLGYPILAMMLFMGVFLAVSLRAFLSRKESFDPMANLPLDLDEQPTTADAASEGVTR